MITEVRAFEGGYCRHLLATVDRRTWRVVKFQAVFFALRHATQGWVVVDTGYGDRFAAATAQFPQRFYRWATPATSAGSTTALLNASSITAAEVRHLVITHFHADHIGGLAEFPSATVYHHAAALAPLQALPAWRQVRAAYLAALLPASFDQQAEPISAREFLAVPDLPFDCYDLFGDGSIRLVYLPGHAPGQVGVAFHTTAGPVLYAADAYWRRCQLDEGIEPSPLAMGLQWDAAAYRRTVTALRKLNAAKDFQIFACHDEDTCARLNAGGPWA
jgi:glyoxylase-like metal-dependent hydrolase (beta-lactamase superfamily II)